MVDVQIRRAVDSDLPWLATQDRGIPPAERARKVGAGEVLLAERAGRRVGDPIP